MLQKALAAEGLDVRFTLTDLFPNVKAFERIAAHAPDRISFIAHSVDARAVPVELTGLRTFFNSFHHFRPVDAVAVLNDSARRGEPVGIFEISERTLRTLVSMVLLTPLMVAVTTPFMRPFRWSRLVWTYLVPLVPLVCWWDGIVSQLRVYTPMELEQLANAVAADGYVWQTGHVRWGSVPGYMTHLIGHPRNKET